MPKPKLLQAYARWVASGTGIASTQNVASAQSNRRRGFNGFVARVKLQSIQTKVQAMYVHKLSAEHTDMGRRLARLGLFAVLLTVLPGAVWFLAWSAATNFEPW
jgi:hypothetical protein